jgi:multiple sugar transport system substrate-binding protein
MGRDLMLLLSRSNRLEPLDDAFEKIGMAHGGWLPSADSATNPKDFGGHRYGIPFGTAGNLLNRRDDILSAAGFREPPRTWEEMAKMAAAVQKPPRYYGMGFALSNVGDGNLTTDMMRSWGGRVADDAGKRCTVDSQAARDFLRWITDAYRQGIFPPGATTWDGAGDNTAYQSGQAVFIANPGSVYLNLLKNDPELLKASKYSALPRGPVLHIVPQNPNVRVIPTTSKYRDLAKDLLSYLADDSFMSEYYTYAIYGPVLGSQRNFRIFREGVFHAGLLDLALNGTRSGWPDVANAALAEYDTNFLTPKMIQKVIVDRKSIDEAVRETQVACQAIYDKYK